jgi:7,8-dihydropterin-6-yl-methyl-4-(beta-D-ribofuranosyl)aminobenzene 5'-phosphate synthase
MGLVCVQSILGRAREAVKPCSEMAPLFAYAGSMKTFQRLLWVALLICWIPGQAETTKADITILSTMVANYLGEGEWGFAALIETPDESILFDTGFKARTVLNNARHLEVDLSSTEIVVLTHFHTDHTGGLLTLRDAYRKKNPKALSTVYVGKGFFDQRYDADNKPVYSLPNPDFTESFETPMEFKKAAEALGIRFVVVESATKLAPGVVLTGPIARTHPEKNVSPGFFLKAGDEYVADTVPESQVVGIETEQGWLLVSGCGHAGIVNASEQLRKIKELPIHMGVGGFHLFRASDETVSWTAGKLEEFGYQKFVGAHCTGAHATFQIREHLDLPNSSVSIGAIGTRIDSALQIHPVSIE